MGVGLVKDPAKRPDARTLLSHPFIKNAPDKAVLQPLFDAPKGQFLRSFVRWCAPHPKQY
jgi:hypothetical protein